MTRKVFFTETIRIVTDYASSTGWYWVKMPERLLNASNKKKLKFFVSAKAERHGPFKTEDECLAEQKKTIAEQIGGPITEGGEWPASWSIN